MIRRLMVSTALATGPLAIATSGLIAFRTQLAEAVADYMVLHAKARKAGMLKVEEG